MKKNQQELDMTDQDVLISVIKAKIEALQELCLTKPELFKVEIQQFFCNYPIHSDRDMVTSIIATHKWDVDLLAALIYKEISSSLKEA